MQLTLDIFLIMLNSDQRSEWCVHSITSFHKSGFKTLVNNYRPSSLLCTFSRVLECIIYYRFIHLIQDSIFKCQFGFLKKCLFSTAIPDIFSSIHESGDTGTQVDVIYIDIEKLLTVCLIMNGFCW